MKQRNKDVTLGPGKSTHTVPNSVCELELDLQHFILHHRREAPFTLSPPAYHCDNEGRGQDQSVHSASRDDSKPRDSVTDEETLRVEGQEDVMQTSGRDLECLS